MEFYKPDLIFHLAAESHVDNSINEPREFLKSNIIGTFNLLESVRVLLKSYSPAKKIFLDSITLVLTKFMEKFSIIVSSKRILDMTQGVHIQHQKLQVII